MVANRKQNDIQAIRPINQTDSRGVDAFPRSFADVMATHSDSGNLPPTANHDFGGFGDGNRSEACELVMVNLSAYLDGELDPDQTSLVDSHLSGCPKCANVLATMQETEGTLEREWREQASLPSSLERKLAIDSIMDALPSPPAPTPAFAPKRVHARTRWTRIASGTACLTILLALLWSSYQIGYSHGRADSPVSTSSASFVVPYSPSSSSSPSASPVSSASSVRLAPAPACRLPHVSAVNTL